MRAIIRKADQGMGACCECGYSIGAGDWMAVWRTRSGIEQNYHKACWRSITGAKDV